MEKVISYTVTFNDKGKVSVDGNDEVQKAIDDGYRLIDVITDPAGDTFLFVTAVLSKADFDVPCPYLAMQ